jgi:hypothetical protein
MLAHAIQSAGTIMFIMAVALASGRWMTIPEPASLAKFPLDVQFWSFHSGRPDAFLS